MSDIRLFRLDQGKATAIEKARPYLDAAYGGDNA